MLVSVGRRTLCLVARLQKRPGSSFAGRRLHRFAVRRADLNLGGEMKSYHHLTMLLLLSGIAVGQTTPFLEQDYLTATDGQITYGTFVDARANMITFIPASSPDGAPQRFAQSKVRRVVRADGRTIWRNSRNSQRYADILELTDGSRVVGLYVSRTATYFRFVPSSNKTVREYPRSRVAKVTLADKSLIYSRSSLTAMVANQPAATTPTPPQSTDRVTPRSRGFMATVITRLLALGGDFLAFSFVMYLIPTYIAIGRAAQHPASLFALNLLLGWTLIGWIAAIIWALRGRKKIAS